MRQLLVLLPWLLLLVACDRPRVLVVGLDGADWDVMDPLMREGYVPTLQRIVEDGVRGEVDCVPALPSFACFCPPVWTALATGRSHAEHGILQVLQPPSDRRVRALWSVLRLFGGTSTTLAMRNSWPPDPDVDYALTIPGLRYAAHQVFDVWPGGPSPAQQAEAYRTHPQDLFETLALLPHAGERPPLWSPIAMDRVSMEALLRLVAVHPTDLTWILLHGPDKVEHIVWGGVQSVPGGPIDEGPLLAGAEAWNGPFTAPGPFGWGSIAGRYIEADRWLGELLDRFRFDYVLLVSDHGMTRNPEPGLSGHHGPGLDDAHRGILSIHGHQVRRGRDIGIVDVRDFAPTVAYLLDLPIAEDLPGRVIEEAFVPGRLRSKPIRTVPSWE